MNRLMTLVLAVSVLSVLGCEHMPWSKDKEKKSDKSTMAGPTAVARIAPAKAAATQPAMGSVNGTVTFTQKDDRVRIVADLSGLQPNTKHGIHIHEKGDLGAPDLSSAGAHWDPAMTHKHGGPDDKNVHAGDLGNIESDSKGNAHKEWSLKTISVGGTDKPSVIGRSVIVHEKVDDLKTDPSGNSGGRIAGGVIEMQK